MTYRDAQAESREMLKPDCLPYVMVYALVSRLTTIRQDVLKTWEALTATELCAGPAMNSGPRISPGTRVLARVATNPKTGRIDVYTAERAGTSELPVSRRFRGDLQRHEKGFGFIDDVFIPGELLKEVPVDCDMYEGIAVSMWDMKKERYRWCAVQVQIIQD